MNNIKSKYVCNFCGKPAKYKIKLGIDKIKYCCEKSIIQCPSRNIFIINSKTEKNRVCDFCFEKPAIYLVDKINNLLCCGPTAQICRSKRKSNDYKLIKLINGKSILCDYDCGKAGKYIFRNGIICCSKAPHQCSNNYGNYLSLKKETTIENLKECLCGCGLLVMNPKQKCFNIEHRKKYNKENPSKGHSCSWKGGKRPEHSKKLRETAHHNRGTNINSLNRDRVLTIEKIKEMYPLFYKMEELRYDPNNIE